MNRLLKFKKRTKSSGTWIFTIRNFSEYKTTGEILKLPHFGLISDDIWHLEIYPHGRISNKGQYVSLLLRCEATRSFVKSSLVKYKISILSKKSERNFEIQGFHPGHVNIWECDMIKKSELLAYKDLYLPNDVLTISCKITKTSHCCGSELIDIPISQHVENLQSLVENNEFGEIITLRVCNQGPKVNQQKSATMQMSTASKRSSDELTSKKKKLKTHNDKNNKEFNENTVDVLEVKDFKVYKGILTSQSPVFEAMFQHEETKENQENLIEINDMDPQVCADMLHFLYKDKLTASGNNLIKLLTVADKYQLMRLKALCEEALFTMLTKENSLMTLSNADLYNANQLKKATIEFITKNIDEIKISDNYQLFKKNYSTLALEIFENAYENEKIKNNSTE